MELAVSRHLTAAVEGDLDEAVARRLAREVNASLAAVYGKRGKAHLESRISGYNSAAQTSPWLVLVDLDRPTVSCAPLLIARWLPRPANYMCLRVAVSSAESWLMGDHERFAAHLGISGSRLPDNPEAIDDPKQFVVNLARRSRKSRVREGVPPRDGSGRRVGPLYNVVMAEFVSDVWRPAAAANSADSLRRCLKRLTEVLGPN